MTGEGGNLNSVTASRKKTRTVNKGHNKTAEWRQRKRTLGRELDDKGQKTRGSNEI